ncbi:hypothetical protein CN154_15210 [Sinorhizobium meliloti]|uniref:hypothetical protein n=1 Tax=Rhizobium meliloti TaxID=382 RepID=UPI000FD79FE2|nr:hypothetical protein [Sinorhizobium meliloti]RVK75450.1 hypothetical protein CN154_15210 [Sinorhizobium meliloti]
MNPATNDQLLKSKEVASLLGWTPETFSRHKKRLIATEGFPAPLPSRRYWRAAVMRWIDTYGDKKAAAIASVHGKSIASIRVHDDRQALTEKYVGSNAA